jgi:hypothetical protein
LERKDGIRSAAPSGPVGADETLFRSRTQEWQSVRLCRRRDQVRNKAGDQRGFAGTAEPGNGKAK